MDAEQPFAVTRADRDPAQSGVPFAFLSIVPSMPGPAGHPIEVAVGDVATRRIRSWLIRPAPEWLHNFSLDHDAAAARGIRLTTLLHEGSCATDVARELLDLSDRCAFVADQPRLHGFWLWRMLMLLPRACPRVH